MILHRVLSFFLTVFIIVPLWIMISLAMFFWEFINQFNFHNFWYATQVPQDAYNRLGSSMTVEVLGRILVIIMWSLMQLKERLLSLKTLKF